MHCELPIPPAPLSLSDDDDDDDDYGGDVLLFFSALYYHKYFHAFPLWDGHIYIYIAKEEEAVAAKGNLYITDNNVWTLNHYKNVLNTQACILIHFLHGLMFSCFLYFAVHISGKIGYNLTYKV